MNRPNDERGFIHKKILGLAGGVVKGFLGGGPLGAVAGAIGGISGRPGGRGGAPPPQQRFRVQVPTPGLIGGIQRLLPGGNTGFTTIPQQFLPPGITPKGPGGVLGALPGVPGGVSGFAVDGAIGG